jgi:hypothetical protein
MKRLLLLLSCCCAFAINDLLAAPPSYIQTKDGVIVFTDPAYTGTSNAVKPEVISDNIIRVTAAPGKEIAAAQSLITVYTKRPADASFNLYEDEGINYNYEKGAFSIIPILYNEATKQVTVGKREGGFNGMLQKRTFRINLITPGKTKQLDMDTYDREVLYDGKQIEVKL